MNWAKGHLMYNVPMYFLYLILFTRLPLTLIHVFVGEPREVQTQPQWRLYGTTEFWKVSLCVSRMRLAFAFVILFYVVTLAESLYMSVYSSWVDLVLDDPVCTELFDTLILLWVVNVYIYDLFDVPCKHSSKDKVFKLLPFGPH